MAHEAHVAGCFLTLLLVGATSLGTTDEVIELQQARAHFEQAEQVSEADRGRLWGHKLYGPMLLVDRSTRAVVANEPDQRGILRPQGGVYVGLFPAHQNEGGTRSSQSEGHRVDLLVVPEDCRLEDIPVPEAKRAEYRLPPSCSDVAPEPPPLGSA